MYTWGLVGCFQIVAMLSSDQRLEAAHLGSTTERQLSRADTCPDIIDMFLCFIFGMLVQDSTYAIQG